MNTKAKASGQDPARSEKPCLLVRPGSGGGRRQCLLALGLLALTGLHLAIPSFEHDGRRFRANESAAIATLRNVASAQAEFRSGARRDRDGDGVGEYGFFAELATGDEQTLPLLSKAFSETSELPEGGGVIRRSGYIYQMFLFAEDGTPVPESHPVTVLPGADQAESRWCCYGWPATCPTSGIRVFFVDQSGVVRETANQDRWYGGTDRLPSFDAAERDGRLWQTVP